MEKESGILFDNLSEIKQPLENSGGEGNAFKSCDESMSKRQNPYIVATFEDRYSNHDMAEIFSNEIEPLVGAQTPSANTLTSARSSYHSIYSEVQGW